MDLVSCRDDFSRMHARGLGQSSPSLRHIRYSKHTDMAQGVDYGPMTKVTLDPDVWATGRVPLQPWSP